MSRETSVIARLEEDARKLTLARKLPEGPLSPELIAQISDDFKAFTNEHQISLAQVSKELGEGFSPTMLSTFTAVREGKFAGDMQRIARGINAWMDQRRRRAAIPMPVGFVETTVAKRMLAVISNTVRMEAIGLIYGPAGIGKTTVMEVVTAKFPGAILVRVMRSTRTAKGLAKLLCAQLRIEKANTFFEAQRQLIAVLEKSRRPIVVDEAHQLLSDAFEFLRDLHDVCEVPIILAGTKDVHEKIDDTQEWFGQLSSRVSLRYDVTERSRSISSRDGRKAKPLFAADEIEKIFTGKDLKIDAEGVKYLTQMANAHGKGGLRLVKRIVQVGAAMRPNETLSAKLLKSVLHSMQPEDVVQSVEFSAERSAVGDEEVAA